MDCIIVERDSVLFFLKGTVATCKTASQVLQEGLESCASLELWLLYLERVRRAAVAGSGRSEQEARQDTIAAFELALQHAG